MTESSVVPVKAEGITYSDVADGVEKGKKSVFCFKSSLDSNLHFSLRKAVPNCIHFNRLGTARESIHRREISNAGNGHIFMKCSRSFLNSVS